MSMRTDRVKASLIKFFQKHNPDQLVLIDEIVEQYGEDPKSGEVRDAAKLFDDLEENYSTSIDICSAENAAAVLKQFHEPAPFHLRPLKDQRQQQQPSPIHPASQQQQQQQQGGTGGGGGGGGGGQIPIPVGGGGVGSPKSRPAAAHPFSSSPSSAANIVNDPFDDDDEDEDDYGGHNDDDHHHRYNDMPPHPAEMSVRQDVRTGQSVLTIPSRGAASLVLAGVSGHSGSYLPLEHDLVLEEERRVAMQRAHNDALRIMKAANIQVKQQRADDPNRAAMLDPGSDIEQYFINKSQNPGTVQRMSAAAHSVQGRNPPLQMTDQSRNAIGPGSSPLTPEAIRDAAAAAALGESPQRQLNPNSSLARAWNVVMSCAPTESSSSGRNESGHIPRPFTRPGENLPARLHVDRDGNPHYIGGVHTGHPSAQATLASNTNTIPSVSGSAWSRPESSHHPPAGDDRLKVDHGAPLNAQTTTTTMLFERDKADAKSAGSGGSVPASGQQSQQHQGGGLAIVEDDEF